MLKRYNNNRTNLTYCNTLETAWTAAYYTPTLHRESTDNYNTSVTTNLENDFH